jgi:hypothetical protein
MMTSFMIDVPFHIDPIHCWRPTPAMTARRTDL